MDGVFMKKTIKFIGIAALLLVLFGVGVLLSDSMTLRNDVVRLHVVANSDTEVDQKTKLSVKDAIVAYIRQDITQLENAKQAKLYLQERLPQLREVANKTLTSLGVTDRAKVYLTTEEFGVRDYDTFSLPSGVYDSLRVEIGQAQGKNWWCVIFPALCLPASQDGFEDVAVSAGFNNGLIDTLTTDNGYEIRFYFLDCLGKIQNFFSFS
jgi:stage II sporulation protein R